ncbi:hypothetical protein XM38_022570 [Halomicronema hongdechloris C2206]|uniref:Uncharacterized protein n=1 Tax=Halomicronema hongdechloris C2206 TaxID=1641165 RepID=A0A1Z3HM04_9CYAN|nr:hypothetical protein XM38_022570 [Halomicronema hongdechloris C2206]
MPVEVRIGQLAGCSYRRYPASRNLLFVIDCVTIYKAAAAGLPVSCGVFPEHSSSLTVL